MYFYGMKSMFTAMKDIMCSFITKSLFQIYIFTQFIFLNRSRFGFRWEGSVFWCKMCGIWAIFGSDQNVFKQCKNSLKIAHRGPDSFRVENISHYSNCCLAFYQLAIMDDLYGMQPMRIKSHPNIYVLCIGEIYNHRTVSKPTNNCKPSVWAEQYFDV